MVSLEEFEKLAESYNVIPLALSMLADVHSPVSVYLTLRNGNAASFLFESVEPHERIGRYSFVGVEPAFIVRSRGGTTESVRGQETKPLEGSIFDAVAGDLKRYRCAPTVVDGFAGGYAGYIGYDCVGQIERVHLPASVPSDEADAMLGLFGTVVAYDHRLQKITIINNVFLDPSLPLRRQYEDGRKRLEVLQLRLRASVLQPNSFACRYGDSASNGRDHFCLAVSKAKEHIYQGDIFQAVLSRRVQIPYSGNPFPIYRALRIVNPSPYLFYLDFGDTTLIGSSPEVLVRVKNGNAELFPIAGTRKRGNSPEEDRQLEEELLRDGKESAEHVMLVDLGRNDLGRVCKYGTVEVPVFKRIERYSHVMHMVSEVRGTVKSTASSIDVLKACFPAGTVTGAPKVRAMQIISELEQCRRGAYAGAVGYIGLDGRLDTCIAIRTIVAHRDMLTIQSGAGIVADSSPSAEYEETVAKAQAMLGAIAHANEGLAHLVN